MTIMMRGVGQIAGKTAMRTGMALSAGFDNILTGKSRFRLIDGKDIVGAVTIIAFGRSRITKLGYLAMICLKICFSNILMATTALIHDIELESLRIGSGNRMRLMAIFARWQNFIGLCHQRRMNALFELLVYSIMTAGAGLGKIIMVDAGGGITARQDMMRRMTIGAHRRDNKTAGEKPLAVNALRIIFKDIMLRPGISHGRLIPLAMALAAQIGHTRRISR